MHPSFVQDPVSFVGAEFGHAHVLAACPATEKVRKQFLAEVGGVFGQSFVKALAGDWPAVLYSPNLQLTALKPTVGYCDKIMHQLKT